MSACLRLIFIVTVAFHAATGNGEAAKAPFSWMPPRTFDSKKAGLGLPELPGVKHTILHDPKPCRNCIDDGGDGTYESLLHGMFNHHQKILLYKDVIIVYWTNHAFDENGPGQRMLAKVGAFNKTRTKIDWRGSETLVELIGAPVPVRRRRDVVDANSISELNAQVAPQVINGRLYMVGDLIACHGWTDDVKYHRRTSEPIPASHWSDKLDKSRGFTWDVWHGAGLKFVQQWDITNGKLKPTSPLYKTRNMVKRVEVTPGRFKTIIEPTPQYANATAFSKAPRTIRDDIQHGKPLPLNKRYPKYAPGTSKLAVDGKNGLAHQGEFARPDGTWVAVRDNLLNSTHYYAAAKNDADDVYSPGIETNLFGNAMPACGELPDGRPWIICNNKSRRDMYITVSKDGYVFDRTWLLFHTDRAATVPGIGKGGGPQYFQAVIVGENLWIVYSITKELIGLTQVPLASFPPKSI